MTEKKRSEDDVARERDATIRKMFATPAKTHKGEPKRAPKKPAQKPSKRGS